MTTKEWLNRAWRIDKMVNAKFEQLQSLRDLATKATSTISDVPPSGTRNVHRMEDIIAKLIDMENEVKTEIEVLVDIKADIKTAINAVENEDYRTLLELRYLCFKPWEEIATALRYSNDHIFYLHRKALSKINLTVQGVE
jgi:DNA-directed RNA polymerase specialized sigma subunit